MRGKCCVEACVFILSIYIVYVFTDLCSIALRKYIWHAALLKKLMSKTTNSSVWGVIFKELICSFFPLVLRWIYWLLRSFFRDSDGPIEGQTLNYKVTPTGVYLSLQFNDNQLDSWEDLDQFKACTKLQTVYLERNPIWKDTAYRRKVKLYLPNVTQIDATLCG